MTLPVMVTPDQRLTRHLRHLRGVPERARGFVLTAPGMEEGRLTRRHRPLRSRRRHLDPGAGAVWQLIVGRDTNVTSRDGGAPAPDTPSARGCARR